MHDLFRTIGHVERVLLKAESRPSLHQLKQIWRLMAKATAAERSLVVAAASDAEGGESCQTEPEQVEAVEARFERVVLDAC